MPRPMTFLLLGVVLTVASILFRAQWPGDSWQMVLGAGILLEILGAALMMIEAKKRGGGGPPAAVLTLLCLLCGIPAAHAQRTRTVQRLDSLFDHLRANDAMRGSVAVTKGGAVLYTRSLGPAYTAGGKPVPATAQTAYRIGSITKTFTATLVMQLVEEGKLRLEDSLARFFPKIPAASRITVRMMLGHRSGLANYTQGDEFAAYYRSRTTRARLMRHIQSLPPAFPPDSTAEYSNTNYLLLGWIVEDLRKKPFAAVIQERIAKPLGLKRTRAADSVMTSRGEALSFYREGAVWTDAEEWHGSVAGAAGNMVSTPTELLQAVYALFTGRFVQPETLRQMQAGNGRAAGAAGNDFGFGMFSIPFYNQRMWGHTGGIAAFHSAYAYNPKDSIGVAILLNGERHSLNEIMIGMLSAVYDRPYALPDFTVKPAVAVDSAILDRYAGTFSNPSFPLKITLSRFGEQLIAQATGQGPFGLEATSDTDFRFEAAGIEMKFEQAAAGDWSVMQFKQGPTNLTFRRE